MIAPKQNIDLAFKVAIWLCIAAIVIGLYLFVSLAYLHASHADPIVMFGQTDMSKPAGAIHTPRGPQPTPDDTLTPGSTRPMTGDRCEEPRGHTPAAVLAEVNAKYRIEEGDTVDEYDHRIPWGCCGATDAENLSPQSSPGKIDKDTIEHWAERAVTNGNMTVAQCQDAFRAPNHWEDLFREVYKREPRS